MAQCSELELTGVPEIRVFRVVAIQMLDRYRRGNVQDVVRRLGERTAVVGVESLVFLVDIDVRLGAVRNIVRHRPRVQTGNIVYGQDCILGYAGTRIRNDTAHFETIVGVRNCTCNIRLIPTAGEVTVLVADVGVKVRRRPLRI